MVAVQQGGSSDAADHVVRVDVSERGQPGGVIAEHIGGDTAEPEHDQRPEHRLVRHADKHLDALGQHGLHENLPQVRAEPLG